MENENKKNQLKIENNNKKDNNGKRIITVKERIKKLLKQKLTISFAESITGGSAAFSFVSFSGASNYFNSSIVAYTNQQKNKLLNVNPDTLFKYGPVSKEVANEMAVNLKLKTTSNICISFTGNA